MKNLIYGGFIKNIESNLVKVRSEKSLKLIHEKKIKFVPCKQISNGKNGDLNENRK